MDGGIDGVYTRKFGPKVQERLQDLIKQRPLKELLVGESLVVPTGYNDIPYLISCPTMRVPLDVSNTANPYLAFKAALITSMENKFTSIICPGLGTVTGNVTPEDCAHQMYTAYKDVTNKFPKWPNSIREAYQDHIRLVGLTNVKRR